MTHLSEEELYQTIFKRRSIRKFEAAPLDEATLTKMHSFTATLRPLFPGIRTELKILGRDDVRGMFVVAAPHYLAIFSEVKEGYLVNAGFLLQQVDLYLPTIGVGSCWLGGGKPTRNVKGPEGLEFVIVMAFGRPATEPLRKSVSEFKRNPLRDMTNISGEDELLEPVRLAPSAQNKQNWYLTRTDNTVHIHISRAALLGRMNEINAGIAACHLWLAAEHSGRKAEAILDSSGKGSAPKGFDYVTSVAIA